MNRLALMTCASVALYAGTVSAAPPTVVTTNRGPLLGPDRVYPFAYGTDLGFTTEWFASGGTQNVVLFGDTHKSITDISDSFNNDLQVQFSPTSYQVQQMKTTITF